MVKFAWFLLIEEIYGLFVSRINQKCDFSRPSLKISKLEWKSIMTIEMAFIQIMVIP